MGPLGFVNWRTVNAQFCLLMWVAAAVLAFIILMHVAPAPSADSHHAIAHGALYRAGAS